MDNILGITNAANPTSLTKLNKAKLGGRSSHTYEYDELNRLVHASGKAKRASYDMVMSFGRMSEPLTKVQKVDSTTTAQVARSFTTRLSTARLSALSPRSVV